MQWARFAVWGVVATMGIGGVALAADALVESDEERITDVADALTDRRAERRIDALLAWVDPSRVAVTVRADGRVERFEEGDGDPAASIRDALAPLEDGSLQLVQRSITVEGDDARVSLRIRSGGEVVDTQVGLRRDGQAWLVDDVRRID